MDKDTWKSIKGTFESTLKANKNIQPRKLLKRHIKYSSIYLNENNKNYIIDDCEDENTQSRIITTSNSKKRRCIISPLSVLNGAPNTIDNPSSDDDQLNGYDPDNDDNCKGCFTAKVKTSNSLIFFNNTSKKNTTGTTPVRVCSSIIKSPKSNWNSLQSTFNSSISEILRLENSILDSESDNDNIAQIDIVHSQPNHLLSTKNNIPRPVIISNDTTDSSASNSHRTLEESIIVNNSPTPPSLLHASPQPTYGNTDKNKKRRKPKKGGFAEQLQIALNRSKSNFAFWQHERKSNLIRPGYRLQIKKLEMLYGRIFLHTTINDKNTVICLDPNTKFSRHLREGITVEVELDSRSYELNNLVVYANTDKVLL